MRKLLLFLTVLFASLASNAAVWKAYFQEIDCMSHWENLLKYTRPFAYVWDSYDGKEYLGEWPGKQMKKADNGMWMIEVELPQSVVEPMIIFNDGNGGDKGQTSDLVFYNMAVYGYNGYVKTLIPERFEVNGVFYHLIDENNVEVSFKGDKYTSHANEYSGSVTIPSTVSYEGVSFNVVAIGDHAMYECENVTSVTIPSSVKSIGESSFYGCSKLAQLPAMQSVKTIGEAAFAGCKSITSIVLPNCVTEISKDVFGLCYALKEATLNDNITSMPRGVFWDCPNLQKVTIGKSVNNIAEYCFSGCSKLAEVYSMPTKAPKLSSVAFDNYKPTIYVQEGSYNSYASAAVWKNFNIEEMGVEKPGDPSDLTYITTSKSTVEVTKSSSGSYSGDIVIPETVVLNGTTYTVTSIGESAFAKCKDVTSVYIPNTVKKIGITAFSNCSSLTKIKIPNSVTSLGDGAFDSCSKLKSATISNAIKKLGVGVFQHCHALASVNIPESVNNIESWAFYDCKSLTSIYIPNSVTFLNWGVFADCTSLEEVRLSSELSTLEPRVFENCPSLRKIISPAVVPPVMQSDDCFTYFSATVYVPVGTRLDYMKANIWKNFADIVEDASVGVGVIESENTTADVYNLAGVLVLRNATAEQIKNLDRGVYIVGRKKIFVK